MNKQSKDNKNEAKTQDTSKSETKPMEYQQNLDKLLASIPEDLKDLLEEVGNEIKEKLTSLSTRLSLLKPDDVINELMNFLQDTSLELHQKFWPRIVDKIRESEKSAEFLKNLSVDVASPFATMIYILSLFDPNFVPIFIAGGLNAVAINFMLMTGMITMEDLQNPNNNDNNPKIN